MKTLILKILLLSIPLLGYGKENSLFNEIFKGEKIGKSLGQKFVSEERLIILYHHHFGLDAYEYKNILYFEESGKKVQIVYVSEKEGIRFDSTENYNQVIWDYIEETTDPDDRLLDLGFGCIGYPEEIISRWITVYNSYPLIEFSKESLSLTDYSKCLIEEYYIPVLNHQADGDWQLLIFFEVMGVTDWKVKRVKAKYLREFFITKGIDPEKVKLEIAPIPECFTQFNPRNYLIGLDIELNN